MAAPKGPIPDAELQLLKLLWVAESMTARELAETIYRASRQLDRRYRAVATATVGEERLR